ncbi:thioredoxin-like domain-containing protein [Apodospora peruviana]|uniref:Protein disulfide-isomerase n=1 Tax=Apodospora peruviana TaxID=516989 RepID=A0AAE0HVW0_9PEZI|nr:thioredoxin-like domain-containing protein [Apodospora peruviana]
MRQFIRQLPFCLSLLGFLLLGIVAGWEHVKDAQTLEDTIAGNDVVLVAYEPKSTSLEPEWLSASAEQKKQLVSIDCVSAKAVCDTYEIAYFPSIVLFKSGKPATQYRGARTARAIIQFLARSKLPTVSEALGAEELSAFKDADDIAFVAFLDPEHVSSAKTFSEVASRYRDEFSFGTVVDSSVAEAQNIKVPSVVCYRSVDGDTVVSHFEPDKLDAWIKDSSRPVLGDLTRGWPMVYLFAPTESARQDLRKSLYKFAKDYYDSLTSVVVDPLEFPELMGQLGLDANSFPAGAVHQLSKDRIYPFPKDKALNANSVQQWGLDVYQGRIKPWTLPGVTTTYEDLGPIKVATRRISMRTYPGMKIKVAGHDEL